MYLCLSIVGKGFFHKGVSGVSVCVCVCVFVCVGCGTDFGNRKYSLSIGDGGQGMELSTGSA